MTLAIKTGPLAGVGRGRVDPSPGLRVVVPDKENDDWLSTLRRERTDAQARVPAGSPRGGQWTSTGGGGGVGAELARVKGSGALTDEQGKAIRSSAASGKNAAVTALQQKIVARYGVPLAKAALMYERDIKAQLRNAKAQRANELHQKREAQTKVTEALKKSKAALDKALEAKRLADDAKKKAVDDKGKAKADKAREKRRLAREKKTAARLADEAKQKEEAEKKRGKPADLGKHADVDAHEKALKAQYGDAARTVAWGRAMHDRGRALTLDEHTKAISELTERGVLGFNFHDRIGVRDVLRADKSIKTVGQLADRLKADRNSGTMRKIGAQLEAAGAVVAHRKALEQANATHADDRTLADGTVVKAIKLQPMQTKKGTLVYGPGGKPTIDPTTKRQLQTGYIANKHDIDPDGDDRNLRYARLGIDNARKRYTALTHKDIEQPTDHEFLADETTRAYHMSKESGHYQNRINVGAQRYGQGPDAYEKVMMHEMGHALEALNPSRLATSVAYLKARTKGRPLKHYSKGEPDEMVHEDEFQDEYQGKRYVNYHGEYRATEISSMGIQELSHGPDFAKGYVNPKHRDTAHFTLGFLANQ